MNKLPVPERNNERLPSQSIYGSIKLMNWIFVLICIASAFLPGPACAQSSFDEQLKLAEEGDIEAQRDVALLYEGGFGVDKDPAKAVAWYRIAADRGEPFSASRLYEMYDRGEGVPRNKEMAFKYNLIAADLEDPETHFELAVRYERGWGTDRNIEEAIRWFTKACAAGYEVPDDAWEDLANDGDTFAQYFLAMAHHYGVGRPSDPVKATHWYLQVGTSITNAAYHAAVRLEQGVGIAADPQRAYDLYLDAAQSGDSGALAWLEQQAGNNNTRAMLDLAFIYETGYAVRKDEAHAWQLIKQAAALGDEEAQKEIEFRKELGIGQVNDTVETGDAPPDLCDIVFSRQDAKDPAEFGAALPVCLERAEAGEAEAQNHVAMIYGEGLGVRQDRQKALNWYHRAAEQGDPAAAFNLGTAYAKGLGTEVDAEAAFSWYLIAAEADLSLAQFIVAQSYADGTGTEASAEKSVEWYRRAAENGYLPAQYTLAYYIGAGVLDDPDPIEAMRWMLRAAKSGFAPAQFELGQAFMTGFGVEKDTDAAVVWLSRAADQGHSGAQGKLGFMYMDGVGVDKDMDKAIHWSKRAAEQDNPIAQVNLAKLYGRLTNNSPNEALDQQAFKLLLRAAENGQPEGQYMLGLYYWTGTGVAEDWAEAYVWLDQAVRNGIPEAAVQRQEIADSLSEGQLVEANRRSEMISSNANAAKSPN